jgi:hypothetical protein
MFTSDASVTRVSVSVDRSAFFAGAADGCVLRAARVRAEEEREKRQQQDQGGGHHDRMHTRRRHLAHSSSTVENHALRWA